MEGAMNHRRVVTSLIQANIALCAISLGSALWRADWPGALIDVNVIVLLWWILALRRENQALEDRGAEQREVLRAGLSWMEGVQDVISRARKIVEEHEANELFRKSSQGK
jgi:hypothetical protein